MFNDFTAAEIKTSETSIFIRSSGSGSPLLLLHGFPETHLMWREIAPILARSFTVVCADLRGYGRSGCPPSDDKHTPYSKRTMAQDMIEVMQQLGHTRFAVAGHDRGGRVAYRMALDHPDRVTKLAVLELDVLPTETVWEGAEERFAMSYWPWLLLAQPEPLPERLLISAPDVIIDAALNGWGSLADAYPAEVRDAYVEALRDPVHAHAICEEYRAAAKIDREHDKADRDDGHKIICPTLALWGEPGALGTWYNDEGGPLALWQKWAEDVQGYGVEGGHFFPEELPEQTAEALHQFFSAG